MGKYITPPRWMRKTMPRAITYIFLTCATIMIFVPIVILMFGSVKTTGQMYSHPYAVPNPPDWSNIRHILNTPSFWNMLKNSLIVMVATTSGTVAICALAAFVFARMQFNGKNFFLNLFTVGLMFPINVAILPVYFVLRQMEQIGIPMIDKLWGVILVQIAFQLSGNIMILRGFFTAVPMDLQDAAYMDGCTNFDFFRRIMLPLVKPSLSAVGALVMIASWNDLLVPLVVLNSNNLWTLPLGTMQFQGQYGQDLALVSAFVALSAIPTIIFYFFAERQIISGLTAGAVKG
ncbi:carbohydrate ABC transporter permease [Pelolinea submarina]|uniref:Carbohydrate ABC transporter membrane protein 2 (CUT1 family) n=1 Tax=Pelolinea submarina TaxID=913107 RepID=A0A347ZTP0_9CHLR|nr:carbohydrate ABC transporter permease [Pelolinea submarina]REG10749.1 carbohydrate ABC transporter membrane protein 2 (CUT1 family) [Pelolinea submarina]BBB48671.1 raffinose/stachyose/melibiose transport system permease protein [Pelolinea submarina]